jgi:hypothetical protein
MAVKKTTKATGDGGAAARAKVAAAVSSGKATTVSKSTSPTRSTFVPTGSTPEARNAERLAQIRGGSNRTVDLTAPAPTMSTTPGMTANGNPIGTPAWLDSPRTKNLAPVAPVKTELGADVPVSFMKDPVKEKLLLRLNDPSLTDEEFAIAQDYFYDKQVGLSTDPAQGTQEAYNKIEQRYQQQAAQQQRDLERQRQLEESTNEQKFGQYNQQLDTAYKPQIDQEIAQAKTQKEDVKQMLAFQGFGRSTETINKIQEVDQSLTNRVAAIEASKAAQAMLYQAQLEGVSNDKLAKMEDRVMVLKDKAMEVNLEGLVKVEELKLKAEEEGNAEAKATLEALQKSMLMGSANIPLSRKEGILVNDDGSPIYDNAGNIQEMPEVYDLNNVITAGDGMNYIPYIDPETGQPKMFATGIRAKVTGSGGGKAAKSEEVYDPKSGKTYLRKMEGGKYVYYHKGSGNPAMAQGGVPFVPAYTVPASKLTVPEDEGGGADGNPFTPE